MVWFLGCSWKRSSLCESPCCRHCCRCSRRRRTFPSTLTENLLLHGCPRGLHTDKRPCRCSPILEFCLDQWRSCYPHLGKSWCALTFCLMGVLMIAMNSRKATVGRSYTLLSTSITGVWICWWSQKRGNSGALDTGLIYSFLTQRMQIVIDKLLCFRCGRVGQLQATGDACWIFRSWDNWKQWIGSAAVLTCHWIWNL